MKFPFFASIIAFAVCLMISIKLLSRKEKNQTKKFWERESLANSTRKQSLDSLNYITIPDSFYTFFQTTVPDELSDCMRSLNCLKNAKIVNLSYISNTDLKLSYGAANLDTLSEYDQNYITMSRTLQKIAEYQVAHNQITEGTEVLEFLISTQTDMIATYRVLAEIYQNEEKFNKLDYLISVASTLSGLTREPILKLLRSLRPSDKAEEESILDILD